MWSYYGSKTNLASLYPKPVHDTIIEPFAGAAKYSLLHFEKEIILIDKYPVIINIWKWLQSCSEKDILSLPRNLKFGDRLDDITFDCQEQKDFYGFIIGCGAEKPRRSAIKRKTTERPNHINFNLQKAARNLYKIRHWKFICGDYTDQPNITATWFVDPPYQFGGHSYVFSNKKINYPELSIWCIDRNGQNWGSLFSTTEAIYTNYHTHFNNIQQKLIL